MKFPFFSIFVALSIQSSPQEALLPGLSQCKGVALRQLTTWKGTGPRSAPLVGDATGRLVYSTDRLGVWLDVRQSPDGALSLMRVDGTSILTVTVGSDCRVNRSRVSVPSAPADSFTDHDLEELVRRHRRLAIYTWSPHMPLSVDALRWFPRMAERAGWTPVLVAFPGTDTSTLNQVAREQELPHGSRRVARSVELSFRNAFGHAPSLLLYADGSAAGEAVPGYRSPHDYERLLSLRTPRLEKR